MLNFLARILGGLPLWKLTSFDQYVRMIQERSESKKTKRLLGGQFRLHARSIPRARSAANSRTILALLFEERRQNNTKLGGAHFGSQVVERSVSHVYGSKVMGEKGRSLGLYQGYWASAFVKFFS